MRSKLLAVLAASSILLSGCYPAFGSYYHVSSTEGQAIGEQCHGNSGPSDEWQTVRGGVRIEAGPATYSTLAGKVFTVLFYVPVDKVVELDIRAIQVKDKIGVSNLSSAAPAIYVYQGKRFVPMLYQGSLDGRAYVDPTNRGSMFRVDIALDAIMPPELQLQLPQMTIDGTSYSAVTVNYEYLSGAWIGLLNC